MRRVNMHVSSPSRIELRAREKVRLDRVQQTATGEPMLEQHGALIPPGTHEITLEPGVYHFRHLHDAALHVVHGGVEVQSDPVPPGKDGWPWFTDPRGDGPCGPVPELELETSPEPDDR